MFLNRRSFVVLVGFAEKVRLWKKQKSSQIFKFQEFPGAVSTTDVVGGILQNFEHEDF